MTIRDSILINCPPGKVWEFVENPELMMQWNPKVRKVIAGHRQRKTGYEYAITYVMNEKSNEFFATYVICEPPRELVIRLTSDRLSPDSFVEERYVLTDKGTSTLLEQRIDIHDSGINIFWRIVVALLMRFGKPVGKRYLETLKELVESTSR